MLRITAVSEASSAVTLKLEGQLVADWATEFEAVCRQWLISAPHVRLDLQDVTFVDRHGAQLVNGLRAAGLEIVNCLPLIVELLDALPRD